MAAGARTALQGGDVLGWFDGIYREHVDAVFAYCRGLLGDRATAEDMTAVVFERALVRRHQFDPAKAAVRPWLFGIARNACLDELRRRRRHAVPVGELPERPSAAPSLGEAAATRLDDQALLERLEPDDRVLVGLRFFAGLSNQEVAEVLGINAGAAATRMSRTLARIRAMVAGP